MGDVFDGVDLNELANSEGSIVPQGDLKPVETEAPLPNQPQGNENEKKEVIDPNAVDLDAIAALETIDSIENNNTEENEEEEEEEQEGGEQNSQTSQTPAEQDKGASPSSQDTFTSLASALVEAGVFSSLGEEEVEKITSVETLLDAVGKQTREARYADLNDNQKKYLEALENGVPHQDYAQHTANADQYKNLADEKIKTAPALQKELIRRSFIVKGISHEEADKYATLAVNGETGAEDALRAKAALVAYEEAELERKVTEAKTAREAELANEQARLAKLKSQVQEKKEIIPGVKVNSNTRDKIFASMTTPVDIKGDDPQNEVMKAYAENDEYKLALHAMHIITKGFKDFSKFTKVGKSSAVKNLEETLSSSGSGTTGRHGSGLQTPIQKGQTSAEIGEALKKMK